MPWTVADVDKHKKGLSDKQKKKWVEIANGVLHNCMSKGGEESKCAVSAIKQANGNVGKTNNSFSNNDIKIHNEKIVSKKQMFEGRNHLIVPATILVEGVHSGSGGPVYYPPNEMEQTVYLWNGVSIPIGHPVDADGNPSTVNDPNIIDNKVVGRFFNAFFEDNKIKGEMWLDEEKLKNVFPEILAMLNQNKDIEISSSLYSDCDGIEGIWNNEKYDGTVSRFIPDHVAILGSQKGACGFEDGCGIRNNSGRKVNFYCNVTTLSHVELEKKIRDKLREEYPVPPPGDVAMCYLTDVWDDHFIYEHAIINGGYKLFQQGYKVKKDEIIFVGEPTEVEKKYNYIPVNNKEVKMEKSEIVEKILANEEVKKDLGLEKETKESLEKMDDNMFKIVQNAFQRITGCKCQEEKKKEDPKIEKKVEEKNGMSIINAKPKTAEEYISEAPAEVKELLSNSLRLHNAKKTAFVKALLANSRSKYTETQLNSKSMEELELLTELADIPVNFEGKSFKTSTVLKSNERHEDGTGVPDCLAVDWTK